MQAVFLLQEHFVRKTGVAVLKSGAKFAQIGFDHLTLHPDAPWHTSREKVGNSTGCETERTQQSVTLYPARHIYLRLSPKRGK